MRSSVLRPMTSCPPVLAAAVVPPAAGLAAADATGLAAGDAAATGDPADVVAAAAGEPAVVAAAAVVGAAPVVAAARVGAVVAVGLLLPPHAASSEGTMNASSATAAKRWNQHL